MTQKKLAKLFEGSVSNNLQTKVRYFRELKKREKQLAKELDETKAERMKFEEELCIVFENDGVQSINMLGYTFYIKPGLSASIPQTAKEKGYKWLRSVGAGSLIYPTINANKFSAFIKERRQLEEDIPDFVHIYSFKGIGMKKSSGK